MASVNDGAVALKTTDADCENGPAAPQNTRSSTPLAADVAAAALRKFARGRSPPSKRSSASSSTSNTSFRSARIEHKITPNPEKTSSKPTQSTTATVNSLDLRTPEDASDHAPTRKDSSSPAASQEEIQNVPGTSTRPPMPQPPPPRRSRGRARGNARLASMAASRAQTPISYSDLGKDYSRYPIASRQNSSTRLPMSESSATPTDSALAGSTTLPSQSPQHTPGNNVTQVGYTVDAEKRSSWLLDDRIGAPGTADAGYTFPLYLDEKELDDEAHMPYPDDDKRLKPRLREYFAPDRLCTMFGLFFMLIGLSCVFILLPVLSYSGTAIYSYPYNSEHPQETGNITDPSFHVNNVEYPLLRNVRSSLIDPDTPKSAMTRKSFLDEDLVLVFSDEFNTPNRTFYPGDDPFWTAPDFWYGATQDLEWYDPDAVTTADGTLTLRMDAFQNHGLNYRSGMLNSWNQACFKGGALEISVSLPGPGGSSGLWPGAWTMGNLGRPGFRASTDGVWPYTYSSCDVGITPNQSMNDGTSYLLGQKLPSCTCPGADHPTPGTGRGAPEIDVFEGSADPNLKLGVITQSYQIAPYDIWYHADYDFLAFPNFNTTQLNAYCGGPYQQAISGQTELNNQWYDGQLYQTYGFEYIPGTGADGQIAWFVGDDLSYMLNGNAIGPNGNVDSRLVSQEPMSIVMNLGISTGWTGINYAELRFPTTMYVDYVRWYQPAGKTSVTCDPPGYETTGYITDHPKAYNNINLTMWNETGYGWPPHRLNTDC